VGGLGAILGATRGIFKKTTPFKSAGIAGVNLFLVTSSFLAIKDVIEHTRNKHDVYNSLISGAVVGAAGSVLLPNRSAKIFSILTFTAVGGMVYGIPIFIKMLGDNTIDPDNRSRLTKNSKIYKKEDRQL